MEARSYVSILDYTNVCMYLIQGSLVPLMGIAYFLQFLDKLALSQATLFNLREDLVFIPTAVDRRIYFDNCYRTCAEHNIHGHLRFSILVILPGVGEYSSPLYLCVLLRILIPQQA